MSLRTKIFLWIGGVVLLFGFIVLVWAIDTKRINIFASDETNVIEDVSQLQSLPSPDQSTFNKIFTAILNLFSR